MPYLLWDASALVKRFAVELGSDTVNALFDAAPADAMVTTVLSYAETFAILIRKRNAGRLSAGACMASIRLLQQQVIYSTDFGVLPIEFGAVIDGTDLIGRHNLNATDAAMLVTYLRYADAAKADGSRCALVSSDARLVRASAAEGLAVINPKDLAMGDVPAFLGVAS